jgi:hypothetical protein
VTGDPTLYRRRTTVPSHVLVRPVADELVLLSLESEEYFGLDPVGSRLWQLLDSSPTVQHAFDAMLAEYDVDPATLGHDLEELVQALTSRRLLELVEADASG